MTHGGLTESQLVQGLELALFQRNIREGFGLLDAAFPAHCDGTPADLTSVSLLLCIAQWTDLGYRNVGLLAAFAAQVPRIDRPQLRLLDYVKLRITEAYQALAAEHPEQTIDILDRAAHGRWPTPRLFALPCELLEGPRSPQAG